MSVVSCLLAASLALGGCSGKKEEAEEDSALAVEVKTAKHKELVIKETYVGTASAQEEVTVYPTASGEVLQVNVKTGDTVTEGQQLFKLDDESARLSLKSAQAGRESAQASANQTLNGRETLQEQQEQQGIDTAERAADTSARAVSDAEENIARGERAVKNAEQDRDDAKDDFDTAKELLSDWEDLQDDEDEFEGKSLAAVAGSIGSVYVTQAQYDAMTPTQQIGKVPIDSGSIDDVQDLVSDVEDAGLSTSQISESGVESLRSALRGQRRAVDSAKDSLTDLERAVESAEDNQANADASLESAIANQEITDGQVLEDTKRVLDASVQSASVAVEQAQYALDQYTTKAPITGIVDAVNIDPHDTVAPSTAAMVISNKDSMKIDFSVTENVRDNLSVGQKVKVIKDGRKYKGAITEVGEMVDATTGLFKIQAAVNGGDGLLNGTTVTVKVDSYRDDSGIVVPYDAVYYSNGEPYLYVVEDGKTVRRDVETGMFDKKHIVIVSGLAEGEQVITSWAADLRDGAEVEIAGTETDSSDENSNSKSEETEGQSDEKTEEQSEDTEGQSDGKSDGETETTEEEKEVENNGQSDSETEKAGD